MIVYAQAPPTLAIMPRPMEERRCNVVTSVGRFGSTGEASSASPAPIEKSDDGWAINMMPDNDMKPAMSCRRVKGVWITNEQAQAVRSGVMNDMTIASERGRYLTESSVSLFSMYVVLEMHSSFE